MNDYSDLVFLIGAMVMFSMLTLNVSRTLVLNNQDLASNEVEYEGIAVAQSIIEQAQWQGSESDLQTMDTNGNPDTKSFEGIEYNYLVDVRDTTIVGSSSSNNKVIEVRVGSSYLTQGQDYPVRLKYIKSF